MSCLPFSTPSQHSCREEKPTDCSVGREEEEEEEEEAADAFCS